MAKTRFHSMLAARIEEEIRDRTQSIADGVCADYASYKQHVGWVMGLRTVLTMCDEIEQELE